MYIQDTEQIMEIKNQFQGRDPLEELGTIMQMMDSTQLKALVMVACNQLATAQNGGDYESINQGMVCLGKAIDQVITAYFTGGGETTQKTGMIFS